MNPTDQALKVVIVEDNVSLADIYKTRLEILGYRCFAAYDGEEALKVIEAERPNLVLLDLMVPKVAGDQILARMRASDWGKTIKVLVISNLNEVDAPAGLRESGIEGYAVKANLTNDDIDKLVDGILKPEGQEESVDLESVSADMTTVTLDEPSIAPVQLASPPISGPRITPFLTFAHSGKQAVDLYVSVFKNSQLTSSLVDPESGKLLHAVFVLDGQTFMAMEAGDNFKFDDGMSLFISCADQAEVDYYWEALTADGGEPGRCGWLKDKYGMSWQVIPMALGQLMSSPDQARSKRVMDAMLAMGKIDIAGLDAAANAA